jgi:hypothetical protein
MSKWKDSNLRVVVLTFGLAAIVAFLSFLACVPLIEWMEEQGIINLGVGRKFGTRNVMIVFSAAIALGLGIVAFVGCAAFLGRNE